mmetsp:Transcript_12301/g.29019  ORF Transcript_12301/g.29019 Transcript_12301/m.29019 type:complete len:324 (-) Transcript_12301:182-1153(-)
MATNLEEQNFGFHTSALRVKNASASVDFYVKVMGMTLIDKFEVNAGQHLYYLATLRAGEAYPHEPGSTAAHKCTLTTPSANLCLIHSPGSEKDDAFKVHPGEQDKDGYGHVGFNCTDPVASCAGLEAKGVVFKKKVDEEPMKGMAFALDPDGYCVEVVKRSANAPFSNEFNFSQTMLRIKDPSKTLPFYERLGLTCVRQKPTSAFTLYFLYKAPSDKPAPTDPKSDEATEYVKCQLAPLINFCHVHGTETQPDFKYFVGQEEGRQGFAQLSFLVDNVPAAAKALGPAGLLKESRGSVTITDPDGYWIELNKRGGYGEAAALYE